MSSTDNSTISSESFEMTFGDTSSFKERNISLASERRRPSKSVVRPTAKSDIEEESSESPSVSARPKRRSKIKIVSAPDDATANANDAAPTREQKRGVRDSRLTIFFGIVLLMLAAYTLLSALSFVAMGNADQSIVEHNSFSVLSERSSEVKNLGGPLGAVLADFMVSRWLGLGSFVVIAYLVIISISLLRLKKCKFWSLTFKSLISAISVSVIAGALSFLSVHNWHWGGEHGYFVNSFLIRNTGVWGDLAVNIILFAAMILIFFDTLTKIFNYLASTFSGMRSGMEERRSRYDSQQAEDKKRRESNAAVEKQGVLDQDGTDRASSASVTNEKIDSFELKAGEDSTESVLLEDLPVKDMPVDIETPVLITENAPSESTVKNEDAEMEIITTEIEAADKIKTDTYDPTAELSRYRLPTIDLLRDLPQRSASIDVQEQEENKQKIIRTLNSYGIEISSITATVGATNTLYEIVPAEGVRISKIKNLGNDMALSLAALGIRIIAPIPGKGTIGMEVPNNDKQIVSIRSILSSAAYQESKAALPMAMGTTISNDVYVADLAKMPHLLVAGATGMGKSVGLNTIIASLLYRKHPAELKFVLIDPKMVEFSLYSTLERHFLAKLPDEEEAIITDPTKALATLNSICIEMDNRYALLREAGVRDIKSYNGKFIECKLLPTKGHRYLPYIVVIVDEFADLITTAGKEVETPISRIAAKARAVGIHMILATQRPSVDVITGVIKANFPGRIAFRVNQMNDSRTILDRPGADQLIGRGDMIISKDGVMERVQCALIETEEVEAICDFISRQIGYGSAYELPEYVPESQQSTGGGVGSGDLDSLFVEAGHFVISAGMGSTTGLQRHFNIGFPRAGKIMDQLERAGVVGPSVGGKPRQVKMGDMDFEDFLRSRSM